MPRSDKIQAMATKAVDKLLGGKVNRMPLEKQVKMTRALMHVRPSGMENTRASLLKDDGLPSDIRRLAKEGKSQEEIKSFYWGCEEFVSFWTLDLQMEEATMDELIRGALDVH